MKISTSSDGSGLVRLPPFHSVVSIEVNGVPTTTGFTVDENGIVFSPIPPIGYSIVIQLNEVDVHQTVDSPVYAKRVDVASSTVTYLGEAKPGSSESSPVWRIQKLVSNPAGDADIFFASSKFNQVWADRASLTYT